jgi:hypothetical protein
MFKNAFEIIRIFTLFSQQTIDEVENLIKKHEAFEKAAAAQEERFAALERLTTVSHHKMSFFSNSALLPFPGIESSKINIIKFIFSSFQMAEQTS